MKKRRNGAHVHHHTLKTIRAVVLGKDGVGKSALTVRFLTKRFIGDYDSTLEATYRHHLLVDGQFVSLDIMDTAGKNSTEKMQMCMSFAELFFVVYSTTDRTSFEEASLLARYILQGKPLGPAGPTIMIVGTKADLEFAQEVEEQEGRLLAEELGCGFYQVSSAEGYLETQELLFDSVKRCFDKSKASTLSRVKEGIVETAKSFRKRSLGHEVAKAQRERLQLRPRSFSDADPIHEASKPKSSSHEDLSQDGDCHRNSVVSTASF
ncbi:ras-related and estrogen-regulated growth inhibitor [Pocillopora verrucosa]|uniref:ras-related and estrogen-regulated growth inhibitor n=1 Tax=Pocillopora verrucosa TaxID=203993 RepID=UPI00279725B3|nr:ras-related and estrogen-regulated growth inhibitor-like [Pocillopora verrucosa]